MCEKDMPEFSAKENDDTLFAQSLPSTLAARAAFGHEVNGTIVEGNWREYPELAPAGLWSTAHDLALLVLAIQRAASGHDTRVLTQQQARSMLTPVSEGYGLGVELDHTGEKAVFYHSGSNAGYKSLLFAYEKTGQGVVILTNSVNGWTLIEAIVRSVAVEYGWSDYQQIEKVSVKPNTALFSRFSGDFAVSNTKVRISEDNGRLYIAGPPLGPLPVELLPSGDYDYFIREKDVTLHFDSNMDDKIKTFTFVDGRPRRGTRIPHTAPHVD